MMKKVLLTVMMLGFAVYGVCFGMGSTATGAGDQVYFGIFREGAPANMGVVKALEKKTGKKFASVMWYQDWSSLFNPDLADRAIKNGAIPHIVWEPWLWSDKERIKLDNIIAGEWDSHIKEWAKDIKAWGKPVFLRWGHEFNIEGYPWCTVNNGRNPKKYVEAYRRVVNIFRREGARNAKFVWCPMNESWPQEPWNEMDKAYPGDDYVDWIGLDGYNWGTSREWSRWLSFKELFRDAARSLWRKHPSKPIMIAEFGSAAKGGDKAKWIREINDELKKMPYIRALNWFDELKETDWRIESSPSTLSAFKALIGDPYFSASSSGYMETGGEGSTVKKQKARAIYADEAPALNGDLSKWLDCEHVVINKASQVHEGSALWKGPQDLSGRVYLKWDENNLYFAADINDDKPFNNSKKNGDIWNGDAVEIVLGAREGLDKNRANMETQDFQIGVSAGNNKNVPASIWIWKNNSPAEGAKIFVKPRAKGYIIEASIPWSNLGGFKPRNGAKIGFDCALDDADSSAGRQVQMVWNGDFLFYKDPGVWGELEFVK